MKYLTKRSCERAIERKIRKYKPSSFSLKPVENGRLWKIGVIFPVAVRAQIAEYELGQIRQIVKNAKYGYDGDGRDVEEVKKSFDDALFGAITALGEIEALFRNGEVTENSEFGIRNSESSPHPSAEPTPSPQGEGLEKSGR